MKKIYLFVLAVVFGFSLSEICFAQEKVKLTYARPGLNQLYLSNLWDIELINLTNDQIEFYLYGTLSESKAGLIATGTTVSIKLAPKEKKKFKVNELPQTPDISYPNADQRFKDALMRKGKLPNGDYTICVYAKETSTNEEIGNDCLEHSVEVETELEITLLNPENNSLIEPEELIVFSWMDPSSKGQYKIKIVEIKGDESPESAMLKNKAFFEKENLSTTNFTYPISSPKFESGKKYAWKILTSKGNTVSNSQYFLINEKNSNVTKTKLNLNDIEFLKKNEMFANSIRIIESECAEIDFSSIEKYSFKNDSNNWGILFKINKKVEDSSIEKYLTVSRNEMSDSLVIAFEKSDFNNGSILEGNGMNSKNFNENSWGNWIFSHWACAQYFWCFKKVWAKYAVYYRTKVKRGVTYYDWKTVRQHCGC
ncbi:MAG TPA: hypothetical protein DEP28_11265 [Bacteroidetes bacterium]|nr:hypothetical protein [Bacteroidota bacterium]